jgi:hypothetical protein
LDTSPVELDDLTTLARTVAEADDEEDLDEPST